MRTARRRPLGWLLLAALGAVAVGEDACPAVGGGPSCRGGPSPLPPHSSAAATPKAAAAVPGPQADLLTQEVEQLQALVHLSQERITLLQELESLLRSGHNLSLPESHARALQERLPLLSDVAADLERMPAAAAEDFLVSKAVISQEEAASLIRFLPLRNPRASSSSSSVASQPALPSALLVAVQVDGTVRLFTPSGELVFTYGAGHEHPVVQLAVSPSHDEYLFATGDTAGAVRVHKVTVRQRRLSKDQKQARRNSTDEKVSQYLGSSVNVTVQLQKHLQVPAGGDDEPARLTALALASQQGNKFYVAGDAEGKLSVFSKNGTLRARLDTGASPGAAVSGLHVHLSTLLFRAGGAVGYLDLDKLEVRLLECPPLGGRMTAATIDSQQASRVLVADEAGGVWAFSSKSKKECKTELQFPRAATRAPVVDLASIRGFVLGLEGQGQPGEPVSLVALNMSYAERRRGDTDGASAVVWRQLRPAVRSWTVHRRYQQGDLLAFLSEDGREIEIAEVLMQVYSAPSQDSFGNFKLPVIAVAIILVLGYQYIKQKGKLGGSKKHEWNPADFGALSARRKLTTGLKDKKF